MLNETVILLFVYGNKRGLAINLLENLFESALDILMHRVQNIPLSHTAAKSILLIQKKGRIIKLNINTKYNITLMVYTDYTTFRPVEA